MKLKLKNPCTPHDMSVRDVWLDINGVPKILAESDQSEASYRSATKTMAFSTPDVVL
jgi:hypothetical protein